MSLVGVGSSGEDLAMGRARVPSMKAVTDIVLPAHTHAGPQGGRGGGRPRGNPQVDDWTR